MKKGRGGGFAPSSTLARERPILEHFVGSMGERKLRDVGPRDLDAWIGC